MSNGSLNESQPLTCAHTPTRLRRIAVLFALRRECQFFLRTINPVPLVKNSACTAWRTEISDSSILILETGVGAQKARQVLESLTGSDRQNNFAFSPDLIISAGFGGALDPTLRVADVIQATHVIDEHFHEWHIDDNSNLSPATRILTCSRLIGDPKQKSALGRRHHAQVVDMESAEIAKYCADREIPLICLRAVSDDVATHLSPHLIPLLSGGQVAPGRLLRTLLMRPFLIFQLLRLEKSTRRAGKNLARTLRRILDGISCG